MRQYEFHGLHKTVASGVLLFCALLVGISLNGRETGKSFVYIQGDKTMPFYVKVNETMQPRYSKNYCIIPKLDPGKLEVEILYQQNIYPPQTYIFDVPENGSRSFLLSKKDTAYALYDLETKTYIAPTIKQKQ